LRLSGLVWRPIRPRIAVSALLVRAKDTTPSRVMVDFVQHLRETIAELNKEQAVTAKPRRS